VTAVPGLKKILWVRHGESEANAGGASPNVANVALTTRGHEQAQAWAKNWAEPPELIVYSPYLRTRQTAAPMLAKFPSVPHEEWPIQEFSFLPATAYHGTTEQARQPLTERYWQSGDPNLALGPGAESFVDFNGRIQRALADLVQRRETVIMVFCHGHFIRGVIWYLLSGQIAQAPETMAAFRTFTEYFPTANTAMVPTYHQPALGWLVGAVQNPPPAPGISV
jgi:broad specificity phosphatase PhoE